NAAYQEREEGPASGREAPGPEQGREEGPQGPAQEVPGGRQGRDAGAEAGRVRGRGQEAGQGRGPPGDPPERGRPEEVAAGPSPEGRRRAGEVAPKGAVGNNPGRKPRVRPAYQ